MTKRKYEVLAYVAKDGKVFYTESDCIEHEANLDRKEWREAFFNYVTRNSKAEGFAPFDGEEHNDSHSYTWVKPNSKSEIEAWNKLVGTDYTVQMWEDDVGKWMCIEESNYGADVWTCSLDYCIDYAKKLLRTFGLDADVKPLTRFEYEDLLAAQERLGKDFDDTLRIVMEYQDDTKGDIDDVIDIYENEIKEKER